VLFPHRNFLSEILEELVPVHWELHITFFLPNPEIFFRGGATSMVSWEWMEKASLHPSPSNFNIHGLRKFYGYF
jgi:hypothetical protein